MEKWRMLLLDFWVAIAKWGTKVEGGSIST
jgi:hypothetical protein